MDICFWNKCNNRCLICTNPKDFWESNLYTSDFLKQRIENLNNKIDKNDSILLTGGEPTIHPDFFETLFFIRKKYPKTKIDLLSNGRRFFYPEFAKKVLTIGNINIAVPLHGHNGVVHEGITQVKGSFEQAKQGIRNLLKYKEGNRDQSIELRSVINGLNFKMIAKILNMARLELSEIDRVTLIFFEIEGLGKDNFKKVGLTYTQFMPFLKKLYPYFDKFREFRLYHFPLCVLDQKFWPYCWRTLPPEDVCFLQKCKKCLIKKYCLGIPKDYLAFIGDKEFKPVLQMPKIVSSPNKYQPIIKIGND